MQTPIVAEPERSFRSRYAFFATLLGVTALYSATPASSNIYLDNPLRVVDRSSESYLAPVGELESGSGFIGANGKPQHRFGTGVLISPCYIVTAAHVVLGSDAVQRPGVDYSMIFRAGVGTTTPFLGHTRAMLVMASERLLKGNDWALMKLNSCVGERAEFGWLETSYGSGSQLVGLRAEVVGYPTSEARGKMMSGIGEVIAVDENSGNLLVSASAINGQSGGPIVVYEYGQARVAGILAFQNRDLMPDRINQAEYPTYSEERANEFTGISFVARDEVRALLQADKARWGRANPNAERARAAVLR